MSQDTENRNDIENRRPEYTRGHAQSLRYTLNRILVMLSRLILAGLLLNLTVRAFMVSPETGLKSIAATLLPLLITAYISFSAGRSHQAVRIPHEIFNLVLYLISGIWLVFLMLFTRYIALYFNRGVPLGEIALSITLSAFIFVTGRLPFRSLVACAYGIISGFLIYVIVFGLSL
jgi:hypothetical protein